MKDKKVLVLAVVTGLIALFGVVGAAFLINQTRQTSANFQYAVEGVVGLDGSAEQADIFEANPCRITETQTQKVVAKCSYPGDFNNLTLGEKSEIALVEYSYLMPGDIKADGQEFIVYYSEGGTATAHVYKLNHSGKLELIDIITHESTAEGDETVTDAETEFSVKLARYNIEYYRDGFEITVLDHCTQPNEYNPDCVTFAEPERR